jgi:hypothetical protein
VVSPAERFSPEQPAREVTQVAHSFDLDQQEPVWRSVSLILSFPHRGSVMRTSTICLTTMMVILLVAHTASIAQENSERATSYVPRLSDLMTVIQIRHSKLFYAVKAKNWPLANFEREQLVSSLVEAQRYYPRTLPPMTIAEEIASSLSAAINAQDQVKFDRAFDEMSAGCNRCHMLEDRAFIVIRRPSYPSAFSNQQYSPRPSGR